MSKIQVQGQYLRVSGYGENGKDYLKLLNRPGFSHLVFEVDDLVQRRQKIKQLGGCDYGDKVTINISGVGKLTLIYMTDPEGNIVELQK